MSQSATTFIATDPARGEVSTFRLVAMRVIFAGTFLFIGTGAWRILLTYPGPWDPLQGVAWSFWAAYGTLMLLGLRYPLKMLPLLLLQLLYKSIWLLTVGYPLWSAGRLMDSPAGQPGAIPGSQMVMVFMVAVAVDLVVIPWRYAFRSYVLKEVRA
jgi:hypothetical protein